MKIDKKSGFGEFIAGAKDLLGGIGNLAKGLAGKIGVKGAITISSVGVALLAVGGIGLAAGVVSTLLVTTVGVLTVGGLAILSSQSATYRAGVLVTGLALALPLVDMTCESFNCTNKTGAKNKIKLQKDFKKTALDCRKGAPTLEGNASMGYTLALPNIA